MVCAFICVCVHVCVMQWFVHSCMCVCVQDAVVCAFMCVCVREREREIRVKRGHRTKNGHALLSEKKLNLTEASNWTYMLLTGFPKS